MKSTMRKKTDRQAKRNQISGTSCASTVELQSTRSLYYLSLFELGLVLAILIKYWNYINLSQTVNQHLQPATIRF